MSKYIINEKALEDINKIWIYTAENCPEEQAVRYYNLIFSEIEYIVTNFKIARDFGNIRKNYRCWKVKSQIIFFKKTKDNEIEVIRILHERMDIENQLGGQLDPWSWRRPARCRQNDPPRLRRERMQRPGRYCRRSGS